MNKTGKQKKGVGYWLLYLALPAIILVIWEAADLIGLLHPQTMPSLKAIGKVTIEYFKDVLRENPNNTEIKNLILELEKSKEF